ncbi:hypothetical protein KAMAJI_00880 [Serratia phage vB_SmaM-Kamaji]|nr:hypothetical protein KAMAJI_00880 [Serratia phage vB_SmaM-Kamaji]
MSKVSKEVIASIIAQAIDLNYRGKRLGTAKAAVAEQISRNVFETGSKSDVVRAILDDAANWPAKPEKVKAERKRAIDANLPEIGGQMQQDVNNWPVIEGDRFIITSAQNNTEVHPRFMSALKTYADAIGAKLLISRFAYNKKGFQNKGDSINELTYASDVLPYIQAENCFLNNRGFAFMAAVNTLPTAVYPLSGFAEIFGNYSGAIGHVQITAESIPAMKGQEVRRMYSTGTVTQRNYIQQKAGQKAEPLHCYGALIVEFDAEGEFYVRQLQTMDDSGEFFDLNYHVTPSAVRQTTGHVAGLQYGDIHAEKLDLECAAASWGYENSLLDFLKPRYQLIHDIHDFTSRNHHNRASGNFLLQQYYSESEGRVADDLRITGEVLQAMERDYSQVVVVESNHDLALGRWLDDLKYSPKTDPANAELYYALNLANAKAIREGDDTFNLLSHAINEYMGLQSSALFLFTDQSFPVAGIECGMHGHNGINGSRGAPKQFKKLGVRANTGHTHTASIYGGIYTAGVAGSLDMGYNIGASSWTQTHIITYENGQRTLIDFKNGKFFA